MKIERLIGILSILLQQKKVTAPYLAEKFEVSRRTINRDIEDICKAGIPIVTTQGQNGGISIMEGYCIDKTLLTSSEMQSILSGLRSLDSVSGTNRYQQLMEKLSVGESSVLASNNHIIINLSSWYKDTLAPKIELIQTAIERAEKVSFTYYSPKGESRRTIEPNMLVFQWASWYVYGYCTNKQSFRLFKLNRIIDLINTGEKYELREVLPLDLSAKRIFPAEITIKAVFEHEMKWRLIEQFGLWSFKEQQDGKLLFCFDFADKEYLFTWLLSFGNSVELLEPEELREEFMQIINQISDKYRR
ncbi:helix-turn-helix transcriptional regulator [Clostridium oryzae]|uniref:HTH domain protein n=1 Tax=Clostridium oryzae TaxID=1450648 RepID=A0A1V4IRW1_9CLOT|nr:YafY family protein [Clostridium oryzae]OPJ62545.1 HTH domain protein [Clostridium oryzae]